MPNIELRNYPHQLAIYSISMENGSCIFNKSNTLFFVAMKYYLNPVTLTATDFFLYKQDVKQYLYGDLIVFEEHKYMYYSHDYKSSPVIDSASNKQRT